MVLQIVLLKSIRSVVAFNNNSINCHKFLYKSLIPQSHVFTARDRSCGKVLFLRLSVIRSRGVSGSGSRGVNPPGDTPWSHTPWTHTLVTHTPDHTHPVTHNTPWIHLPWTHNGFEIACASEKHMVEDDILLTNHF